MTEILNSIICDIWSWQKIDIDRMWHFLMTELPILIIFDICLWQEKMILITCGTLSWQNNLSWSYVTPAYDRNIELDHMWHLLMTEILSLITYVTFSCKNTNFDHIRPLLMTKILILIICGTCSWQKYRTWSHVTTTSDWNIYLVSYSFRLAVSSAILVSNS